jgi:hypothetical protein
MASAVEGVLVTSQVYIPINANTITRSNQLKGQSRKVLLDFSKVSERGLQGKHPVSHAEVDEQTLMDISIVTKPVVGAFDFASNVTEGKHCMIQDEQG